MPKLPLGAKISGFKDWGWHLVPKALRETRFQTLVLATGAQASLGKPGAGSWCPEPPEADRGPKVFRLGFNYWGWQLVPKAP